MTLSSWSARNATRPPDLHKRRSKASQPQADYPMQSDPTPARHAHTSRSSPSDTPCPSFPCLSDETVHAFPVPTRLIPPSPHHARLTSPIHPGTDYPGFPTPSLTSTSPTGQLDPIRLAPVRPSSTGPPAPPLSTSQARPPRPTRLTSTLMDMNLPHVWTTENHLIKNDDGTVFHEVRTHCAWCRVERPEDLMLMTSVDPCPTRNRKPVEEQGWL